MAVSQDRYGQNLRIERVETAIDKLADVSVGLKTIIAGQDQRLINHEKILSDIQQSAEKRRDEIDAKLRNVYEAMKEGDKGVLTELGCMKKDSKEAHAELTTKISRIEKYIWIAIGGGMVVTFIISNLANYLQVLFKVIN